MQLGTGNGDNRAYRSVSTENAKAFTCDFSHQLKRSVVYNSEEKKYTPRDLRVSQTAWIPRDGKIPLLQKMAFQAEVCTGLDMNRNGMFLVRNKVIVNRRNIF